MAAGSWQRAIAVASVLSFLVTSCTSLHTVAIPSPENPSLLPAVKAGDSVEVTTKTMERKTFEVTAVEADALVGRGVRVPYAEMATLEVKRIRKGPTAALIVGIVIVVGSIIAAAQTAEAINDIMAGPAN
jgi:hypothetical protein